MIWLFFFSLLKWKPVWARLTQLDTLLYTGNSSACLISIGLYGFKAIQRQSSQRGILSRTSHLAFACILFWVPLNNMIAAVKWDFICILRSWNTTCATQLIGDSHLQFIKDLLRFWSGIAYQPKTRLFGDLGMSSILQIIRKCTDVSRDNLWQKWKKQKLSQECVPGQPTLGTKHLLGGILVFRGLYCCLLDSHKINH